MNSTIVDTILKLLISAAAALTGWYAALRPLFNFCVARRKRRREAIEAVLKADKEYRQTVLDKLTSLEQHEKDTDTALALIQRDNIERAYCMFVVEHGYCPSGMKHAIYDMYLYYTKRGNNHIAKDRVDELMELPEFPPPISEG